MKRTHNKTHNNRKAYAKWLSAALILSLLISLVGCGGATPEQSKEASNLINHVEIMIPNPTVPEAIVGLQGNIALQYYMTARMYLEKLSMINAEEIDRDELVSLLNDTITAFENAEKMSSFLSSAVDLWMKTDDKRDAPKVKVLHRADEAAKASWLDFFILKSYAAENSASEMTAWAIVNTFDKAQSGHKLRTLAELLGTDARHAMEHLKIAQATLEGADAMAVAEQATNCIKVAKGLKTAGTVAGLVIAAAPAVTGSLATMATGEMIATTGGIVMSGVNSTLEIASTGATLYYGTDENKITNVADAIADSKLIQSANTLVGLAGIGYNVKNMIEKVENLTKQPGVIDVDELLSLTTNNGKETSDLFGIVTYTVENPEVLKSNLVTFSTDLAEEGIKIILKDTEIGTSPEQQDAMKALLEDVGYSREDAEAAIANAVKIMGTVGKTETATETETAAEFSAEFVNNFLKKNEWITPSGEFDPDAYIADKQKFMESLASAHPAEEATNEEQNTGEATSEEQSTEEPSLTGEVPAKEEILGTYDCQTIFGATDMTISDAGAGKINFFPEGDDVMSATYDAATATALFSSQEEEEDGTYYVKLIFRKQGGKIKLVMIITEVDEEGHKTSITIPGVKR